ncbi:MAG: DUF302 domain-containing protein [Desulfovibrio sp.]|uniref:DUF302 domain-containing protein n=1 Tax=Desulfovibrio sp. TaxID=885 RepID=UPI00135E7038|nr:DUF302 domain-containing protein [Desulfovibrio sp.]MTJ93787.1 DUF302 domain-containing protein [Desulfovibrio sp.]
MPWLLIQILLNNQGVDTREGHTLSKKNLTAVKHASCQAGQPNIAKEQNMNTENQPSPQPASQEVDMSNVVGLHAVRAMSDAPTVQQRLENWLAEKNIQIFYVVDHAANAKAYDLFQLPAWVTFFGNPAVGTPLMVENPLMSLNLPLKVLVYEDASGATWLAYHNPAQQAAALGIKPDHPSLKKMETLLKTLAQAVTA